MGKRSTSKHAASGSRVAAAHLRRLLVAAGCGAVVFALSGVVLSSAAVATRFLLAGGVTVAAYAGLVLAKVRGGGQAGRRRAVPALPVVEDVDVEDVDQAAVVEADDDFESEVVADVEGTDETGADETGADETETELVAVAEAAEAADDADYVDAQDEMPGFLLEQLMLQAMDDELDAELAAELAEALADEPAHDPSEEATPEDRTAELAVTQDADVVVPEVITHDLVPISSLYEARAEAERLSLQRFQATVRGLGVRTGDDPVAVDVLARVVAAVDRLMVTESFERPVLSETGPLLAAAAAVPPATPPAREATPLPSVPTMRPSDMPVTELSSSGLSLEALPEEILVEEMPDTEPIEAVVVEDPDLVLPIPAPPRPQPAHRRRRLRRNSVA